MKIKKPKAGENFAFVMNLIRFYGRYSFMLLLMGTFRCVPILNLFHMSTIESILERERCDACFWPNHLILIFYLSAICFQFETMPCKWSKGARQQTFQSRSNWERISKKCLCIFLDKSFSLSLSWWHFCCSVWLESWFITIFCRISTQIYRNRNLYTVKLRCATAVAQRAKSKRFCVNNI